MRVLGVILARAGSKGVAGKNVVAVGGRPMVAWTIEHAWQARTTGWLDAVVLSTDGTAIAEVGRAMGVTVVDRPADLASATATVDAAARHAVQTVEQGGAASFDAVVILYGNVPIRPTGLIGQAVAKLRQTGCDSVQSVCPAGKRHPYWMKRLAGAAGDAIEPYTANRVYRRQDLPAVQALDGGLIAVRRESLFRVTPGEPHAFLGNDQRAVVTQPGTVVDVDDAADVELADAMLRQQMAAAAEQQPVHIGGRRIDRGDEGVFVIAELGVNHDGSIDRAMQLAETARACGADAIKVQVFEPGDLLSDQAELAAYQQRDGGEAKDADAVRQMLGRLRLDEAALTALRARARRLGLGFVATCFSPAAVQVLRRLDVDAVKIASPDAVNRPLVEAAAELGRPLLISTGACSEDEIQRLRLWLCGIRASCGLMGGRGESGDLRSPANGVCGGMGGGVVLMHCVSAYPTAAADANLRWIGRLAEGGAVAGYSDHTTEIEAGMLAVAGGARVIEKHLTYDCAADGPDHAASFDGDSFQRYVQLIRQAERMLGPGGERRVLEAERDVRRIARQSVCTTRPLKKGHVLRTADVTVRRPGTGIAAANLEQVVGLRLRRDLTAGTLLGEADVEPADVKAAG